MKQQKHWSRPVASVLACSLLLSPLCVSGLRLSTYAATSEASVTSETGILARKTTKEGETPSLYALSADSFPTVRFTRNGAYMYRTGALIDGEVYVPLYLFVRNYTNATYTYTGGTVTVNGNGLTVTATVGQSYIIANGRVLYTGLSSKGIDGNLWVPLKAITRAVGITYSASSSTQINLKGQYAPILHANKYYREDEVYWLSRIISAESKGEPLQGQIAVGCVVLNRVKSSAFPNTIYGVIFDKKYGVQFSPVSSGTIYDTPTDSAVLAAKICLEGYTLSSRALYFFNPKIATSSWIARTRPYIMTIGNHKFYA